MRTCRYCNVEKILDEFPTTRGKKFFECKLCANTRVQKWTEANRERSNGIKRTWEKTNPEKNLEAKRMWSINNKDQKRDYRLQSKYGLTLDQYKMMLTNQKGLCVICETSLLDENSPCVDHDHITGRVRQLLCRNCNLVLGLVKEKPETLRAAADYLEFHKWESKC
jgi:hypothetical protein